MAMRSIRRDGINRNVLAGSRSLRFAGVVRRHKRNDIRYSFDCRHRGQTVQIECSRVLGHVVDEHADSGGKMFAAEIADVVTAVVRRILRETADQLSAAKQIANLICR